MGKDRKKSTLQGEDQALWKRVAQSVTPLSRDDVPTTFDFTKMLDETEKFKVQGAPVFSNRKNVALPQPTRQNVCSQPLQSAISNPIEKPILRKLAKGRQSIDARLDLHGMTQDRARSALLEFLQLAQAVDHRIVLVITGKGNAGLGILKQRVPDWLSIPPFTNLVNGFRESHVSHGGEGALYVRIRRNKNRSMGR